MDKSILIACVLASACGSDSTPADAPDATISGIDAGVGPDATEENFCTVLEAAYGDLGALTGTAILRPGDTIDPATLTLQLPLNADTTPDVLFLELWEEGVFQDGFSAKTVTLTVNQADLVECSACAYIAADFTEGQLIDFHMTYSGQLVIDTIDVTPGTGQITGSLSDLKLRAVTVDGAGQQVTPMGCKTTLENITFDFAVALAPVEAE